MHHDTVAQARLNLITLSAITGIWVLLVGLLKIRGIWKF